MVGNNAKGRISKRVFQESKACQNFRQTNISYPLMPRFALFPYYRRMLSDIKMNEKVNWDYRGNVYRKNI